MTLPVERPPLLVGEIVPAPRPCLTRGGRATPHRARPSLYSVVMTEGWPHPTTQSFS